MRVRSLAGSIWGPASWETLIVQRGLGDTTSIVGGIERNLQRCPGDSRTESDERTKTSFRCGNGKDAELCGCALADLYARFAFLAIEALIVFHAIATAIQMHATISI